MLPTEGVVFFRYLFLERLSLVISGKGLQTCSEGSVVQVSFVELKRFNFLILVSFHGGTC
jgi:hypothetical protein